MVKFVRLEADWNKKQYTHYPEFLIRLQVERCGLWGCVYVHFSVCVFAGAEGINRLWDLSMFWGRGD